MSVLDKIKELDWFDAGYAVFKSGTDDSEYYPPLNDMEAQREWLGGFGAAWAECPDDEATKSIFCMDGTGGESVNAALARVLRGRADLLRQLHAHGYGRSGWTVH